MANETPNDVKTPAPAEAQPKKESATAAPKKPAREIKPGPAAPKKFEVVRGRLNLGRDAKGEVRILVSGDTITEADLPAKDIKAYLAAGILADADAPIPPSKAEGLVAFDRLARIALALGAAERDGGTYTMGGREFAGIDAFRKGVTLDDLETAILETAGVVI